MYHTVKASNYHSKVSWIVAYNQIKLKNEKIRSKKHYKGCKGRNSCKVLILLDLWNVKTQIYTKFTPKFKKNYSRKRNLI